MEKTNRKKKRLGVVLIDLIFLCLLLCGIVLAVCVGKYPVSVGDSLGILVRRLFGLPCGLPEMTQNVVMGLRVPRILASVVVGAAHRAIRFQRSARTWVAIASTRV